MPMLRHLPDLAERSTMAQHLRGECMAIQMSPFACQCTPARTRARSTMQQIALELAIRLSATTNNTRLGVHRSRRCSI
jgi:hypothetical protein